MKKVKFLSLSLLFVLNSCNQTTNKADLEKWKSEVIAIEKEFNDMAQTEGLSKAFSFYAAPDGVIRRGKNVIQGKEAIKLRYEKNVNPNETLTWKPTFVDVSSSGDLAYTYGDYIFTSVDTLGRSKKSKGIFHTVWKRQADGEWRFVWD